MVQLRCLCSNIQELDQFNMFESNTLPRIYCTVLHVCEGFAVELLDAPQIFTDRGTDSGDSVGFLTPGRKGCSELFRGIVF